MGYVLVDWPDSQELMELDGFENHSSLADCDEYGQCAYFVDEDWLNETDSE